MQQMDGKTHDIVNDNLVTLKQLFPEAFSEDKVDFEKLQLLLGANITNDKEKYSFSWKGKNDAIKLALAQNTGTLRPDKESSKNWDTTQNIYIEGDNLEVLRTLQDSYRGQVKMIYIDPPYNTGKDFVYKDDFHDNVASYKEKMGENMKSNPETNGRYHTDWLNMMYPRLKLARNLLKDDGVIFISIDDNEVHNLRKICDETFGEDNFVSEFIWNGKSGSEDDGNIRNNHEYLLSYSKNILKFKVGLDIKVDEKFPYFDENKNDNYKRQLLRKWGDNSKKEDRPNLYYAIKDNLGNDFYPKLPNGDEGCWRWGREKMLEAIKNGYVEFLKNREGILEAYEKIFESDENKKTKKFQSLLLNDGSTSGGTKELKNLFNEKIFDRPKESKYILKLIKIANTNNDDIILDFFSGSATTAHAVIQLNAEDGGNRKFIMVQIPEKIDEKSEAYKAGYKNICEIGKDRIRKAGERILEENKDKEGIENLDIGFKVFKLDTTNLKKWETSVEGESEDEIQKELQMRLQDMTNPVKEDRNQIDMVYEIILKNGMDLSLPMEELSINGKKIFSIAQNYLIACLEKDIDLETVKDIANLNPKVAVFYDDSFSDDVVKVNAIQNLEKNEIQVRVI